MNVKERFRHKFHITSEKGLINDPNGFSTFKDKYHLFYQYYPFDTVWGPMHWGHSISNDLIKWDYEKIALTPSEFYV